MPPGPSPCPDGRPGTGILDEPPVVRGPIKTPAPADVDHYFDRLDQAFATLSNASQEAPKAPARTVADEIDWFGGESSGAGGPGVPDVVADVGSGPDVASGLSPAMKAPSPPLAG